VLEANQEQLPGLVWEWSGENPKDRAWFR